MYKTTLLVAIVCLAARAAHCIQLNVGIDHDVTGPTYGLEGKTSSQVHYDEHNGLNLKGTISDLLGPPIKIANGMSNVFKGSELAGLGTGLKSGGAMLGFDAKLLEAAGAGNMLKGGFLLNGANIKSNLAGQLAGPKGQKIANIIEVPIRVVAMKDVAAGKVMSGLGQVKQAGAQAISSKGQTLFNQGQAMKSQGVSQMLQGANEGVQNINNMVTKTAENFNTAFKLLPLVWDMHQQQAIQQREEATKNGLEQHQQQQQHLISTPYQLQSPAGGLTGGSLFGGLSSLLPGLSNTNTMAQPNPTYAAVWNSTSPLTNLLMNPATNPFLFPLAQGPLGQAFVAGQPIGTPQSASSHQQGASKGGELLGNQQAFDFNLFPGLKYHEVMSSELPRLTIDKSIGGAPTHGQTHGTKQVAQQQVQQVQQQVQQPIQQETKTKSK